VDLVPEIAPRGGVDAGGGFVEQQHFGLVQHAGGQREALLPAARETAGELRLAAHEVEPLECGINALAPPIHAVHATDEIEVLADAEVFIQAKTLRHVAHAAADGRGFAHHVVAQCVAFAAIGGEQAAHHADRGSFA